ncbi:MAG TPA: hypothetical protein VFP50_11205 [Anaeromyxobacteraceae bacterium]|nr:hypothetical protein [Anaeromyxobacteraceae bacterium]
MTARPTSERARRRERGAALLVVMVAVALVTALAVDLAYQARVSLQIAGNGRDELRAEAAARGAVALSRLVLHFQSQLDEASARTGAMLGQVASPGAAGGQAGGLSMPRPQIWKLVPVSSMLVSNLFGEGGGSAPAGAPGHAGHPADADGRRPGPAAEGGPEATFEAVIDDEDRKVNVQLDALATGGLQGAQLEAFLQLVADRRWDFLFEREDEAGQRVSRTDLAIHLKDWVDADQVQSSITGVQDRPFEDGFGDENFAYDRGPDRYKAKNARFDSLDELYLVSGVSDAFMAAFGDRLTVYLSQNSQMNVNADDPQELLRNARIMADPKNQPLLSDPTFPERLQKAARELRLGGFLAMTPFQFASLLETLGVVVHPDYTQARNVDRRGAFTDRSRVFHVRGTGTVGRVQKSVEAVVTFDPDQARDDAGALGRLLHWHEE